jgi:hypothetical protein
MFPNAAQRWRGAWKKQIEHCEIQLFAAQVRFWSIPLKKAAVIPMYWRQGRRGQAAVPAVMQV